MLRQSQPGSGTPFNMEHFSCFSSLTWSVNNTTTLPSFPLGFTDEETDKERHVCFFSRSVPSPVQAGMEGPYTGLLAGFSSGGQDSRTRQPVWSVLVRMMVSLLSCRHQHHIFSLPSPSLLSPSLSPLLPLSPSLPPSPISLPLLSSTSYDFQSLPPRSTQFCQIMILHLLIKIRVWLGTS